MTCDEARRLAPEAALDLLDGAARADVLAHVATCGPCRTELDVLAATADLVLTVVPPAEPPPGFEGRVLARLGEARSRPDRRRGRRWLVPAAAAVAAALAGLGAGVLATTGEDDRGELVAAELLGSDGRAIGQVLLSDDPDRMVCVLEQAPAGARYEVTVVAGGRVLDLGAFTAEGPGRPWATELPVDGSAVQRVEISDPDGTLRASARLG